MHATSEADIVNGRREFGGAGLGFLILILVRWMAAFEEEGGVFIRVGELGQQLLMGFLMTWTACSKLYSVT